MSTQTISSTEFQHHPGTIIDRVRNSKETLVVTAHGRPQMVVLSVQEYETLLAARRELGVLREDAAARARAVGNG